jgi:hypothetical protein
MSLKDQLRYLREAIAIFAEIDWAPYVGKRGSAKGRKGFKNKSSGRVHWGPNPPKERKKKEVTPPKKVAKKTPSVKTKKAVKSAPKKPEGLSFEDLKKRLGWDLPGPEQKSSGLTPVRSGEKENFKHPNFNHPVSGKISPMPPQLKKEEENGNGNVQQRAEHERPDSPIPGGDVGKKSIKSRQGRILTDREQFTGKEGLGAIPENLQQHLSEHQKFGAAKAIGAIDKYGGFLLADGTGVGKSRQILAVAQKYANDGKKVVIVAPAEVIKPDWKKGSISGSYADDGSVMRISPKLSKGDVDLQSGQIAIMTYNEIGKLKSQVDQNTVVLFDESHALKNSNSARGKHGRDIGFKAGKVMYATATPADKPLHIAHLLRAGVFGGGDPQSGKFFGKSADTYRKLGLMEKTFYNRHSGKEITTWAVDPRVGTEEAIRRMNGLFDQMTKDGLMVQRSLSMDNVDASVDQVQLPPEAHDAAKKAFDDVMDKDDNKALALMAMRRSQEPFKIPAVVDHVKEELKNGRQPIIFLGRVNDNLSDDDDSDEPEESLDENTARQLKEALVKAGVSESDIGELHGAAAKTTDQKRKAIVNFNAGKTKVLISTVQSGGVGVNLDDRVGDKPRTVIMMTPPLSANDMIQAAGRINRLSTKSNAKIVTIISDHKVDEWNMGLLSKKMKTMGAVLGKSMESMIGEHQPNSKESYNWGESLIRQKTAPIKTTVAVPESKQQTPSTVTTEKSHPVYHDDTKKAVHAAVRAVHGGDNDRARDLNGIGFNKFDSEFGHSLANQESLNDKQTFAAINMIRKYKNQIPGELYEHVSNPKIIDKNVETETKTIPAKPAVKSIETRKVNTKNGERHVYSFAPGKKFWDLRKAGKLPSAVGVSKNPRTDEWEATIWGTSPDHTAKVYGELKSMGLV